MDRIVERKIVLTNVRIVDRKPFPKFGEHFRTLDRSDEAWIKGAIRERGF